jgi:hypothetical protein
VSSGGAANWARGEDPDPSSRCRGGPQVLQQYRFAVDVEGTIMACRNGCMTGRSGNGESTIRIESGVPRPAGSTLAGEPVGIHDTGASPHAFPVTTVTTSGAVVPNWHVHSPMPLFESGPTFHDTRATGVIPFGPPIWQNVASVDFTELVPWKECTWFIIDGPLGYDGIGHIDKVTKGCVVIYWSQTVPKDRAKSGKVEWVIEICVGTGGGGSVKVTEEDTGQVISDDKEATVTVPPKDPPTSTKPRRVKVAFVDLKGVRHKIEVEPEKPGDPDEIDADIDGNDHDLEKIEKTKDGGSEEEKQAKDEEKKREERKKEKERKEAEAKAKSENKEKKDQETGGPK